MDCTAAVEYCTQSHLSHGKSWYRLWFEKKSLLGTVKSFIKSRYFISNKNPNYMSLIFFQFSTIDQLNLGSDWTRECTWMTFTEYIFTPVQLHRTHNALLLLLLFSIPFPLIGGWQSIKKSEFFKFQVFFFLVMHIF